MLTTWTLYAVLHFGTPQQRYRLIAERLTWADCLGRALYGKRRSQIMTCEPVEVKA